MESSQWPWSLSRNIPAPQRCSSPEPDRVGRSRLGIQSAWWNPPSRRSNQDLHPRKSSSPRSAGRSQPGRACGRTDPSRRHSGHPLRQDSPLVRCLAGMSRRYRESEWWLRSYRRSTPPLLRCILSSHTQTGMFQPSTGSGYQHQMW